MSQPEGLPHTDSIETQDPNQDDKKRKAKNRRPANTAFRQQRLKAWQPILTPKTVLPLFFTVGIIFAPIGGLLLWASSQVQEIAIDYSNCIRDAPFEPAWQTIPSSKITRSFKANPGYQAQTPRWQKFNTTVTYPIIGHDSLNIDVPDTNVCRMQFDIEHEMKPPVLLYYRLTNFYQNHRRYVKSFDQDQLKGNARSLSQIDGGDCDPLKSETQPDGSKKPYYPCGLIANSLFNDTIQSPFLQNPPNSVDGKPLEYVMKNTGIAWDTDGDLYKNTTYDLNDIVPPLNWRKKYPTYNATMPPPDLHIDESFQVWMRTAGLPTFSKLALRNDNDVLQQGYYQMEVWDEFNVTKYTGTKSILLSTRTVMGGKNPFLGIAYIVVGGICIVLGAIFTATHIIKPRKLGDHTYLTWNNEQPSNATATGSRIRSADAA